MHGTVFFIAVFGAIFALRTAALSGHSTHPPKTSRTVLYLYTASKVPLKSGDHIPAFDAAINGYRDVTYPGKIFSGTFAIARANSKNIKVLKTYSISTTPNSIQRRKK